MTYQIDGDEARAPWTVSFTAETAVGALERLHAAKMLCVAAVVRDAHGRLVSHSDLMRLAETELG